MEAVCYASREAPQGQQRALSLLYRISRIIPVLQSPQNPQKSSFVS